MALVFQDCRVRLPMASSLSPTLETATSPSTADYIRPLSSRSLFWKAKHLGSASGTVLHIPFLFWLVETCRPRVVVDLALGEPTAYFAFCQAVERLGLEAQCFARPAAVGFSPETHAYNEAEYEEISTLLDGDDAAMLDRIPDGKIDLAFIDMAAAGNLSELASDWSRKLSDNAVLLLHGARNAESLPEPLREIGKGQGSFQFDHGDGLCVLLKGGAPNERLQRLCALGLGDPGYAEVQQVFSRLGRSHQFEQIARNLRSDLKQARAELDKARSDLAEAEKQRAASQPADESDRIALRAILAERTERQNALISECDKLSNALREAREKNRDLNKRLSSSETEAERLRHALSDEQRERSAAAERLAASEQSLAALRLEMSETLARLSTERTAEKQDRDLSAALAEEERAHAATRSHATALQARLDERFAEIAEMTRLTEDLRKQHAAEIAALRRRNAALASVATAEIGILRAWDGKRRRDAYQQAGLPALKDQIATVASDAQFDATWYRATYPDVVETGLAPAEHYVLFGAREGRNPGPHFDTAAYYMANTDVAATGVNALVHYAMFGRAESRPLAPAERG